MASFPLLFRFLKNAFFEDWILKIICLIFAVLMWSYVDGELTDQRSFPVPIRSADIQLPAGWQITPNHPLPEFLVSIKGPRRRLPGSADVAGFKFKKQIIDNPKPGRNVLNLGIGDLQAEGFEILNVTPKDEKEAGIDLSATTSILRKVLVRTSKPRAGFLVEKASTEPTEVLIEGRSEDLEQVLNVWTEEMDVSHAEEDIIGDLPIAQSVVVNGKTVSFRCFEHVRATILIRREAVTRRMSLDVRTSALAGAAMTVDPRTVEVEVTADAHEFDDIPSKVTLYADWPSAWERPKDTATVLGPLLVQVRVIAPPRIVVRGVDGKDLPSVKVRAALAGALSQPPQ